MRTSHVQSEHTEYYIDYFKKLKLSCHLPVIGGASLVEVHVAFVDHGQIDDVVHGSLEIDEDSVDLGLDAQTQVAVLVDVRVERRVDEVSLQVHRLQPSTRQHVHVHTACATHELITV